MSVCVIDVDSRVVEIRGTKVLLDSDVAFLYGVETKRVNEAVRNNPDKFPSGYIISLKNNDLRNLRSKISTANSSMYNAEQDNETEDSHPENSTDDLSISNVIQDNELQGLRSKISTANLSMSRVLPKAFTEKGLYMLATILKSPQATQTTLAIIETFTKIRELTRTVSELANVTSKQEKKLLMQKSGEIFSDILGESLNVSETETTLEINLAVMNLKHSIKRKK